MRFFTLICLMVFSTAIFAADISNESKIERIGGTFKVTLVERLKDGGFKVEFEAVAQDSRFKKLVLESSHVHVSVAEGFEIRLSADVLATSGSTAAVSQVVLFIPGRVGHTPVWMLSRKATVPTPPSKLIDMHAPSTDYQIM